MARYKHIDTSPRFLAVDLQRQLLPGTLPITKTETGEGLPEKGDVEDGVPQDDCAETQGERPSANGASI